MNYLKNRFLHKIINFNYKNIFLLYCERIDVSEGIDINKTSGSKECDICHYLYFLNKGFKFETCVWNRCHNY